MKKKLILINFLKFFENDKKRLELDNLNKKFNLELHEFYQIQSESKFEKVFNKKKYNLKSFKDIESWKTLITKYIKKHYIVPFGNNNYIVVFK